MGQLGLCHMLWLLQHKFGCEAVGMLTSPFLDYKKISAGCQKCLKDRIFSPQGSSTVGAGGTTDMKMVLGVAAWLLAKLGIAPLVHPKGRTLSEGSS